MFTATSSNGPRLPVINRRVTPTEAGNYVITTDVIVVGVCPMDNRVGSVRLYERPLTDSSGVGINVRDPVSTKTLSPSLTYPPPSGSFYANPFLGMLFFNYAHLNASLQITYTAMGSLVVADDINWIFDNAKVAANPFYGQAMVLTPGQTKRIDKMFITTVWEVGADNTIILNPDNILVRSVDINDKNTYGSTITNTGQAQRSFLWKGLPMQTPES